jgi:hypothetical protein
VGGHDHGRAAGVAFSKQVHDLERQVGIEIAGRLVGEDELRIVDERARDAIRCCSPPDSSREGVHAVLQPDPLEHLKCLSDVESSAARRARA